MLKSILSLVFGYSSGRSRKQIFTNGYGHENIGEAQVHQYLAQYCRNTHAHVLNNITLRLADGSTTQIDHILFTTKGIFVIETKHYSGWIFANAKSKVWTQTIYYVKNSFQNPIFQNYKHVRVVQKIFDFIDPKLIHNFVVFTGDAEFKTTKPDNVFYIEELIPAIERYPNGTLSLNRLQFCVGRLEYMRLELSRKTDVEHHAYLTEKFG